MFYTSVMRMKVGTAERMYGKIFIGMVNLVLIPGGEIEGELACVGETESAVRNLITEKYGESVDYIIIKGRNMYDHDIRWLESEEEPDEEPDEEPEEEPDEEPEEEPDESEFERKFYGVFN